MQPKTDETPDTIDFSNNYLDIRDIIARSEYLKTVDTLDNYDKQELETLKTVLKDLEGQGGDEQYHGSWYPITLLHDKYFEEAMNEIVSDCYNIDTLELPAFITITIDYDTLKRDYSEIEIEGNTFYYR